MSEGLNGGVHVGSPINRKVFVAVGKRRTEGKLTSTTSR